MTSRPLFKKGYLITWLDSEKPRKKAIGEELKNKQSPNRRSFTSPLGEVLSDEEYWEDVGLKISARNRLKGKVISVEKEEVAKFVKLNGIFLYNRICKNLIFEMMTKS